MPDASTRSFPEGFLWGAATSAYQIEGSPLADGAGASIWHQFSHTPGRIANDDNGDVACDHYNRYLEDVSLIKEIGLQSYRFSVSWGRVLPEGKGQVNPKGLAFYDRLVDELLESGIQPMATLYHWDLPAALEDKGGWLNPDSSLWFADYAQVLFDALDDRVERWLTLNEPWVIGHLGYWKGIFAPGHQNLYYLAQANHNLLRAHAAATHTYRATGKHQIGLAVNFEAKHPASDHPDDIAAAKREEAEMNQQYLDVVFFGRYPEALPALYGDDWPNWNPEEVEALQVQPDFLGINYYTRVLIQNHHETPFLQTRWNKHPTNPRTHFDWEVYPDGLREILCWIKDRYGSLPMYVTENGAAFDDPPKANGHIHDEQRVDFLRQHFKAAHEAIQQGVDLKGYHVWSLLDNFEWASGYDMRFGIVHVDFETQQRTLKDSARFFQNVIRTNGASVFS